jgi:hypothetical protein
MKFEIDSTLGEFDKYTDGLKANGFNISYEGPLAYVEINSLEQLLQLRSIVGNSIIIGGGPNYLEIEIYDYYRE